MTTIQALLIDRDGVLIKDAGFVHKIEDFEFYPLVIEALQLLDKQTKIIIITNQAGIANGIFTEIEYFAFRDFLHAQFNKNGIHITAEYFCPHHPKGIVVPYNVSCSCRKPATALFEQAIKDHHLTPSKCWTIGDMRRDILAGQKVGIKGILVKTGFGGQSGSGDEVVPDYVAEDLYDAVQYIKKQENKVEN